MAEHGNDQNQKRDYFRLDYFKPNRPSIQINRQDFPIIDLSEKGVRFEIPKDYRPQLGAQIRGLIRFEDKSHHEVVGTVLRYDSERNYCVVVLSEGVPLAKMMEEQRRQIRKYKK